MIRHVIDSHTQPIPSVLEIPSKDHPYDASKDSILRRAKVWLLIYYYKTLKWIFFIDNIPLAGHVQSRRYTLNYMLFI